MSLSKLFNGKYLLQNIKKSRMTLALFFILVPIFTSLVLVNENEYAFEFEALAAINIIGMYIIPFIFSICLFGYVFKKSSVDFIGSMPISRKSIFITNTIGGIGLILLLQIVTFFLTLLISSLTKGIVFAGMAWDIFIYQTVAYIFVFVIANLAMSVSGNFITQIAVTMLIAFMVPFSIFYINGVSNGSINSEYTLINGDIDLMNVDKIENFTAPFMIANEGEYYFSSVSLWKMIILSLIYFAVGLFVFEKRKMEVAGESFENKYTHLVVKGLTIIPFVAILRAFYGYNYMFTLALVVFGIIAVYYFLFDLITSKKIKFFENIIALIVSVATLYGVYSIAIKINENIDKKLDINSINSIYVRDYGRVNLKVQDKSKVKTILTSLSKAVNSYYEEERIFISLTLNKNDGTKFEKELYVSQKAIKEAFDDSYKNTLINDNAYIHNSKIKFTDKERKEIIKHVNDFFSKNSVYNILTSQGNVDYGEISINEYSNHEVVSLYFPLTFNNEVQKIVINAYNRYAVECLKNGYNRADYTVNSFNKFNEDTRKKVFFVTQRMDSNILSKFILKNEDNVPDDVRKCIKISTFKFEFYTDRVSEFIEFVSQICLENKEEFDDYISGYDEDYYYDYSDEEKIIDVPVPIEASKDDLQSINSGDTI